MRRESDRLIAIAIKRRLPVVILLAAVEDGDRKG